MIINKVMTFSNNEIITNTDYLKYIFYDFLKQLDIIINKDYLLYIKQILPLTTWDNH